MKQQENQLTKAASFLQEQENDLMNSGATMQRMQTTYATAISVQKPRDLDRIVENVMREAEYAGEDFFYAWGEGKNHIEGNSVGLALCVVREWGNCAVETDVKETNGSYIFSAHFIDLETGFTLSRTFRQSKNWTVYGKLDDFRKDDMRYQIGQSKAIRNVVNNAMPRWLLNQARERAKQALEQNITKEGIVIATEKAIKALGQYGVSEERILSKLEKAKNQIAMADIMNLRTAYAAIKNGEAAAEDIFPKIEEPAETPKETEKTTQGSKNTKSEQKTSKQQSSPETVQKETFSELFLSHNPPVTVKDAEDFLSQKHNIKCKFDDLPETNKALSEIILGNMVAFINQVLNWTESRGAK